MKTIREIINTHSIEKNEDILQDMVDELYTYVEYRENLKVIEELERIPNLKTPLGEEIRLSYHYVLKRIKELKQ
jgi:hypothetical protein